MIPRDRDLALLRRYEPILTYTRGERFFPVDAEDYIRCCSLWQGDQRLVEAGELTADRLVAAAADRAGAELSLLLVQRPFDRREVRAHRAHAKPPIARSGRLAAVGLIGRVFDVLLRASLFLRGSVPGGVAAAAADLGERHLSRDQATYYGRVVREGGYIVLQYWYLYAMNDWRTTFAGVNDHEADWESVTVYLTDTEDGPRPAWVAVSAHDERGDDLRRRWDDPDLRKEGDHPVVFVGAGSHSGAFLPGQYLVTVNPARLRRYVRWAQRLMGLAFPWSREERRHGVGIPFIDYALGDGERIGPGRDRTWRAVLISDETPWVRGFRGLWGRDTRDWVGGERAPAGPRYERDGRVRTLWADPLGWAGLQKIPPSPEEERRDLRARIAALDEEIKAADAAIERDREELRRLRATATSLAGHRNTRNLARRRAAEVARAEAALAVLVRDRTELAEERAAHEATLTRPFAPETPNAHLREPHLPYTPFRGPRTRFLHTWAALSTPLFLLAVVGVFVVPHEPVAILLAAVVLLFVTMEAWVRRKLLSFATGLLTLAGGLAVAVGLGLAVKYGGRYVLLAPLVVVAGVLLVVNLRELFHR
ncbi:hypothetical protein NE235_23375 [Actinoallomurus spadix]|uniref:Uncharacterized protein n=1 Tax=Actinoallomurus spadix TaxID=79912 RepID=A0ABN0WZX2_9ACTN|nr:hypothetical protein [Actinoallomurus spadix]MCO5989053.1 hypothetical protein [Actinoallomurus spadix]